MDEEAHPLLEVRSLDTGYGEQQVLNGVDVSVPAGRIVAVIGHNGSGKSTLLKAIFGVLRVWNGQVIYDGTPLCSATPRALLQHGIAYIPQGNRVFTDLSVRENLEIGGVPLSNRQECAEGIERALVTFPALRDRLNQPAGILSGGEKQMLALADALVLSPRLLLLDEPSLGLAPGLVAEALGRVQQLNRDKGVTVLIVEQKVREVLNICHYVCCLKLGKVVFFGPPDELRRDNAKLKRVFV